MVEENNKPKLSYTKEQLEAFTQASEKKLEIAMLRLSKYELLLVIMIGVFGNGLVSYIFAFDMSFFQPDLIGLLVRIIVWGLAFYLPYNFYRKQIARMEEGFDFADKIYTKIIEKIEIDKEELMRAVKEYYGIE